MTLLMEDLMKEIRSLSSRLEESQSDSNSTSEVGDQARPPGIGLDLLQMRNKSKSRRRRGRKRRLESHPELETGSESSFVDSSDEEVARDYCENSKINVTDSDEGFVPMRKCLTLPKGMPWSPLDFGESDSYSENIMNFNSRRKRKIKKNNKKFKVLDNMDELTVPSKKGQMKEKEKEHRRVQNLIYDENDENLQAELIQFSSDGQRLRGATSFSNYKNQDEEFSYDDYDNDDDDDMMEGSDVSSEEESEGGSETSSSGSNEADDEGEESCIESNIPTAIPFWEDEKMFDDKDTEDFQLVLSQSFKLLSDESKQELRRGVMRYNRIAPKVNGNGNFITYANKRTRAFLQHEDEHELCLHASCENEQDQILELGSLYHLNCRLEDGNCRKKLYFTKTRDTREPDRRLLKRFLRRETRKISLSAPSQRYASKRRKTATLEAVTTENATPIPENNIGNRMLRSMGWTPGTGLGRDGTGIIKPLSARKRPKKQGLGYSK